MGRSILLTRVSDGSVKAFNKRVPAPPVTDRIGMRHRAPALVPLPRMDLRPRRQPRRRARQGGVPESSSRSAKLTQLPATEYAGFLWLALDRQTPLDVAAHLGPLGDELDSWGIGRWSPLGEKVLDSPINWKLAIDTFAENYHFATVHKTTFATIARSNCTVFDSFGPHHRLVFPLNGICDLEGVPEHQWDPLQNMVVIYALFPTSCCRRRWPTANCSGCTRPMCRGGRSPRTRTRHRWTCPTSRWRRARERSSTTPMPPCGTKTIG